MKKSVKDKALSVSELTKYLADRYKLRPTLQPRECAEVKGLHTASETYENAINYDCYRQKLDRIMKDVKIQEGNSFNGVGVVEQEVSIWDLMKEQEGTTHRITVHDFLLYCFDSWSKYLTNRLFENEYDSDQLEADRQVVQKLQEEEHIKMMELLAFCGRFYVSDHELRDEAMYIMLKALFELFFTPIDEEKLRTDMQHDHYLVDEDDVTDEDMEIYHRLHHPEGIYYQRKDPDHI